jgi:hypothetical protein
MPRREQQINTELSPQELNQVLIEAYHYDLYDFSHSLAIVLRKSPPLRLWNIWLIRKANIPDLNILVAENRRLKRIKRKLTSDLKEHLSELGRIENPLFPDEFLPGASDFNNYAESRKDVAVQRIYKLDETIINEIDALDRILSIFRRTQGSPATAKNIIGSLWSLIMRDSRRIHIEEIENLIDWFFARLEATDYSDEINGSPSLADISRFLGRGLRSILEQDRKEIFSYNYSSSDQLGKFYPFQICFDKQEPKFIASAGDNAAVSPILIFPNNLALDNPSQDNN